MYEGMNYINGEFVNQEKQVFYACSPYDCKNYGCFPLTCSETVNLAVDAAKNAFDAWRKTSRVKRAELFDQLAQLIKRDHEIIRDMISLETGKSLNESNAEVNEALHTCQYVAGQGRQPFGEVVASELDTKDAYIIRKPRGVIGIISCWNFPFNIGSFWCAAPALVEGNCVVHKPSELTPMVNQLVGRLYHEAGFPPGVFNLIHGNGVTGDLLVKSNVDVILFTGSAEVAKLIKQHCASEPTKTCSVEAGSKSATIVFADGDLELAVDAAFNSAFKLTGQRCVSSGRILVQRNVMEEFKQRFLDRVKLLMIGSPFAEEGNHPFCGPLISKEQLNKVNHYKDLIRQAGEQVKVLFDSDIKAEIGYFSGPLVFESEWSNQPYLKDEIFGPVVALVPFDTVEDAIRIYNDTEYGLALGIISDNFRTHRKIAQECVTGMLYINGGSIAAESHLPFSSWKKSGYGASAAATYKAVTHTMAVTVNYEQGSCKFAQGMK